MMQIITIAKGDGIGPEIMDVTLKTSKEVGTETKFDELGVGAKISLVVGATWLICAIVFTVLEPNNIFFTLFLGLGIFFSVYALTKTQKL
jgi:isocitrate/isopropylmalate dehydrogenase